MKNKKGFTLIELMVVIVIIGILAALAIPKFMSASSKAKVSEIPTVMGSWEHAQLAYQAETGVLADAVTKLTYDAPVGMKWFSYTQTGGGAAAAVYTAKNTVQVGSITVAAANTATSTVATTLVVTHDAGPFATYLPNF